VAGQNINQLDATTGYNSKQVTFDATARQPQRSVTAAGSILMHPDHQEVHLQRLLLDTRGQQWQLAPGRNPAIQYGHDEIAVKDVELVSGRQTISADGVFGDPDARLQIVLKDLQLASIDALMLRPPQFTGTLNATSIVSGTKASPDVNATFEVAQGGFRQFRYDTLGGTVKYAGKGVTVDTRLQQNPTNWIAAKGYIPVAAFAAASSTAPEAASAADRFDFHVDSSQIDLGLVQGFTNSLTGVRGSVQAHVDVTGPAGDPQPAGVIDIANGAFTVAPTGVSYTDLDGRINLAGDGVHVDSISVVDNHDEPLRISGDLALHAREVGAFNVYVNAYDFKVIDNKIGNVRIDSDLRVAGTLTQPQIEGDLGVNTGVVNLDPLLAQFGTSAYATKPTEYATAAADQQGQRPQPTGFGALRMNVHVTIPDDLVLKANDLKLPDAPIGLGAMNMTLGGDLRITKASGDAIKIVGPVRTIRGYYDFQGRRFTLLRDGTVQFVGLVPPNPTLNIKTERVIQGVTANVNIQGSLRQPRIVLGSTPTLDQAEILSLIVFNEQLNQMGEGQQTSLAQRAEQLAAGQLAGALSQSIGKALNLSEFEISAAPDTGAAAQLTVGEQVGQNLYVKVQQGIGDQSQTNLILEYELTDWLRLQTNVLQGSTTQQQLFRHAQGSGVDLLFFFSY
jgi:translocation and assembly module TamB